MKSLLKPLLASVVLIGSSYVVFAESYSQETLNEMIRTQDDNENKKISRAEYLDEALADTEDALDLNHDGYITSNEVAIELKEGIIDTVEALRKQGVSEEKITKMVTSNLNSAQKESEAIVKKMDADKDGLVEPEELKSYQNKKFDALDKNHDGNLSAKDLKVKTISPKKATGGFGFLYNKDK
jgi:Ca2+-binding EF-hand superfamily protein